MPGDSTANERAGGETGDGDPFVTVIMPIRNEERFIERSLGAILAQNYPPDRYEVLVADGMSTDRTREIARAVAGDRNVTILDNPGKIAPTALNIGIRHASGEIIVRVDGHTEIAPDYIRKCVDALERTGAECVGGRMDPVGQTSFGRAVAVATSNRFSLGGSRFHYATQEQETDSVYMGTYVKRVFSRVGLFDEGMVINEDDDFNYRLRSAGGRVVLVPGIRSIYYNRGTPGGLWRQYFKYGLWKVRVVQKLPGQVRLRHLAPSGFVSFLVVAAALSAVWVESAIALAGMVALYALFVTVVARSATGVRAIGRAAQTGLAIA
ncbi:MAG: glycosyltransferase family 2 protein, partial [Chloroflexi bacterium]|nr:glycosyltransferase family 2 protein [Chloroflexota bacterium]